MQQIPAEVTTMIRAFSLFWMFSVSAILIAGQWWQPAHDFRDRMLRQWKPSLVIALLHALGAGIGGVGFFQLSSVATFCQAMIGLALACSILGFEPLPVTQAVIRKEKWIESLGRMLGAAMAVVIAAFFVNGLLWSVLLQIFGETMSNPEGFAPFFPPVAWRSFLLLLAGAGIAEETTYRLVCMSLFWRLTRRPWVAIVLSALLFGAYHLSPLDALYHQYWERPLTVFTMSTIMGVVMGYVYLKRGYESAVLGHTLGDWIPMLLSGAA
jgi:membrane protease YdiL (CAAX protease family)